jgi:hypothetical protein
VSVPVALERLRSEIENFALDPYVLTVSDDNRPHCVSVAVQWDEDQLVMGAGNRTLANAAARPSVSLLWAPTVVGGYSLIVDATATATSGTGQGDNSLTLRPTRAVLHRPATEGAGATAPCGADCVPVFRT